MPLSFFAEFCGHLTRLRGVVHDARRDGDDEFAARAGIRLGAKQCPTTGISDSSGRPGGTLRILCRPDQAPPAPSLSDCTATVVCAVRLLMVGEFNLPR